MPLKILVLSLTFLFAGISFGSETSVLCSAVNVPGTSAQITYGEYGEIDNIKVNNIVSWSFDGSNESQTMFADVLPLIKDSGVLQELMKHSKVKKGTYKTATLRIIVSKPTPNRTLSAEEQLEIIGDDGAGIAFLQFRDGAQKDVGNALFAGWAGIYNNCK